MPRLKIVVYIIVKYTYLAIFCCIWLDELDVSYI